MDNQDTMRIVTFADLLNILVRHLVPILLAAFLCAGALLGFQVFLNVPEYNSTATLYVLRQDNSNDYIYTQSDFTLALNVVNDCTYMLKSHAVLDDVIDQLGLQMSYGQLYSCISTRNPDGTRVLEVSVKTESASESKRIVDSICQIASDKISAAMGMEQLNIYSYGTLENRPCNTIGITTYVLAGIVAAIVVYALYLLSFILDDRIKTEEDVRKYLNLSVLSEIPYAGHSKRKKGKKRGYYYSPQKMGGDKQ